MFTNLNQEQQKGVLTTEGPVLIIAGAGSGKTRVLTTRIKHLIETKGVKPEKVLAVTFTNKAAKEMEHRVGYKMPWLGTFHSICGRILRRNINLLPGYTRDYVIFDDGDQMTVIKKVLADLNIGKQTLAPRSALAQISGLKNKMILMEDYFRKAETNHELQLAEIYKKYQQQLTNSNALDFDDMLLMTIALFQQAPELLRSYQEQFVYVMVDEYQDTNKAQYLLVKMLAARHQNICVVGDSDQNIYSWRGADISNILSFEQDYQNVQTILLEQNYRSTANILQVANAVIKNNLQRKEKKLWTQNETGENVTYYQAANEHDEARWILDKLDEERNNYFELNNYAVFYRTNAQSRVFEEELMKRGMKYRLVGGVKFYSRKEVKDIIAYLRLILNPQDNISLNRIINLPTRGIGALTLERYVLKAAEEQKTLFAVLGEKFSGIGDKAATATGNFKKMIEDLRQLAVPISVLIEEVVKRSGYRDMLMISNNEEDIDRLDNIFELVTLAEEKEKEGLGLPEFLEHISLVTAIDEVNDSGDAVTLMTLHSAKGLEFPVVFFSGLEESVLPHFRSLYDPAQMEEERRLCYVGITRAQKKLYLSSAKKRSMSGETRFSLPSRFIEEVPAELLDQQESTVEATAFGFEVFSAHHKVRDLVTGKVTEEPVDIDLPQYLQGEKVFHNKWGEGKVLKVFGSGADQTLEIQFMRLRKTIMPKYAKINKL